MEIVSKVYASAGAGAGVGAGEDAGAGAGIERMRIGSQLGLGLERGSSSRPSHI